MNNWQLRDDQAPEQPTDHLQAVFAHIYSDDFANAMMGVNHALRTEVRGCHEKAGWGMGVLLNPWMLTKIYLT